MPYVLLGLALLVGGVLIAYWFSKADPKQVAKTLKITAVVLLGGLGILLVVARQVQLLAALPILAGLLWKLWPLFNRMGKRLSGGQSGSDVRTRFFAMHLDHASGHVDGEVLVGVFAGRRLSELSIAELQQLHGDVSGDPQSLALIEAYLDRRDPDWRGAGAGGGRSGRTSSAAMSAEEAYEILGLSPGASAEEIRRAHRRLMQKLHPDAGGSDWLAAKLNAAKELLLQSGSR